MFFIKKETAEEKSAWLEFRRVLVRSDLPSFGTMLVDQTDTGQTAEELDASIEDAYENRLY